MREVARWTHKLTGFWGDDLGVPPVGEVVTGSGLVAETGTQEVVATPFATVERCTQIDRRF